MNSYVYPYLLRSLKIEECNQVWATDYTYIKLGERFVYLTAYIDIYSRYIVGWGLFETLEAENSLEVLWRAVALYGRPQIINTDQGSQYVCRAWETCLKDQGIQISMNRKATPTQNIYIERFWRTLKYARFFRRSFVSFDELERTIGWFVDYYNHEHRHISLDMATPASVYGIGVGNFVGSGYFYRNFDITYEQLVAFQHANGHTLVPHTETKLNQWCLRQRKAKKEGVLHHRKTKKLDQIGFVWDYLSYAWSQKYEQLCRYADQNGHPNVIKSADRYLHDWCCDQRKLYKTGKLDSNWIELLQRIGFAWDALSWLWDRQYSALEAYRSKQGHCNVQVSDDPVLASWVLTQRAARKAGKLPDERKARLDTIGFDWQPLGTTRTNKLKALAEHLQQIQKSQPSPKEKKMYDWYQKQKIAAKCGNLSEERWVELKEIGLKL